jgi:hypothetical protein
VKLDSEKQRQQILEVVDLIPLSITNERGQPAPPTAGMVRKAELPENIQAVVDLIVGAEIEKPKG